ncbi:hypothetical protein FNO01nite_11820 [Flavobacterium noncentrifugens]|uniref:histidine kinase n=1 Tax=Flavobacterium noncentrifugens TaxID=1128970 RepID=A0A1G8VJJ6_9FLAO|nr:PAS domain S-box protein [Flavobacterium noncentrifugens]GEP50510.1 hypothetical protein FNO01nite_11820 [Flavobacterium noncentrifugens]SDJ65505.1 PAS domain S-box-containing protein [Flavobacterium noncentrifugens]
MDEHKNQSNLTNQLRNRLDSLLEGIQVIDFNWRYIYLNDVTVQQSKAQKEDLLGFTMMEKFPGIENTPLFRHLNRCMTLREPQRFENEFVYPDESSRWFQIVVEPDNDGICVMSIDITPYKKALEKISKGKSLYAFLSQINQNILHVHDEKTLFRNACDIATAFGKFKIAWIGLYDETRTSISLIGESGLHADEVLQLKNLRYAKNGPQDFVLRTKTHYICSDIQHDLDLVSWAAFAEKHEISSCIVLPLWKMGRIIGTFNLYSNELNFTEKQEIDLLTEVASDLSFAIDNFEKAKQHRFTEELVIKNEKRFRALIEKSVDMKTLANKEGKVLYGSPSITEILGYDMAEMLNSQLFDIIHTEDLPVFLKKRNNAMKVPGKTFSFQIRVKHKNGHWLWCEGIGTNLLNDPAVNAMVSNFTDITEKKLAEQQREFDRNNLDALINNTGDIMWSIDNKLKLITFNKAFDELITTVYGKSLSKGDNIIKRELNIRSRKMYRHFYARALAGESFTEIVRITYPDGNWSEISFNPIRKGNEIVGVACHSRDISERIKSEQKLENKNKALMKANFELDRFAYSVSHDLRSPLTSMLGLLSFIEDETRELQTREHAKMIRSSINRLDGFIKNILSYSRNNRTGIEIEKINPRQEVADVVNTFLRRKKAANISFELNIAQEDFFYSDKIGFCTVVENIISNAIKFHSDYVATPFVKIIGFADPENFTITIEDNGIGIAAEQQHRIFDMFFRSSAKIEGSGIGLYIAKEIVEKLEGSISFESHEEKGTLFKILFKNLKP